MKFKKIRKKLEQLRGGSSAQKSAEKKLVTVQKLLGNLEQTEQKFKQQYKAKKKSSSKGKKLARKLNLVRLHIEKAKLYSGQLETEIQFEKSSTRPSAEKPEVEKPKTDKPQIEELETVKPEIESSAETDLKPV